MYVAENPLNSMLGYMIIWWNLMKYIKLISPSHDRRRRKTISPLWISLRARNAMVVDCAVVPGTARVNDLNGKNQVGIHKNEAWFAWIPRGLHGMEAILSNGPNFFSAGTAGNKQQYGVVQWIAWFAMRWWLNFVRSKDPLIKIWFFNIKLPDAFQICGDNVNIMKNDEMTRGIPYV